MKRKAVAFCHVAAPMLLLLVSFFLLAARDMTPGVIFTHGVASGDVTPSSAVLWTRVDQEARLLAEVASTPDFRSQRIVRNVLASAESDFTAKALVGPLEPDRTYFYRFRAGSTVSETGIFRTPGRMDVRFAFSGDSDGTLVEGAPFFNNFETLDAAREEGLDFFIYLGDTIYSDSSLRAEGPAETLEEYRQAYKVNREMAALRDLMKSTSIYLIWDDHEVRNDFDGETVDRSLYLRGRRAFLEFMPLMALNLPEGRECAAAPLFRAFHWGKEVDLIILDERSCRSADVEAACLITPDLPDPAPTLPAPLRRAFLLPPQPPAGCLEAIADPSRTMLGKVQKTLLKDALRRSEAKFKFIVNELPIQQYYALPYDRWEGYAAERAEILNFIRANRIENVVFLTTDIHSNLINEVFIDRFSDPRPVAMEFVTGPIATFTLEREILNLLGPRLGRFVLIAYNAVLTVAGVNCRHLDAFSYGLVEVDSGAGTATVTLKRDSGEPLFDQRNPDIPCAASLP